MPNPSEIERLGLSICPDNRSAGEKVRDEVEARLWNAIYLEDKEDVSIQELNDTRITLGG